MDAHNVIDAVDAFSPLAPGAYAGGIAAGVLVETFVHNGNEHGTLGLSLDIGEIKPRVVRCSFLIDTEKAIGIAKRDTEVLAKWVRLVDVDPVGDWFDLVEMLWVGQQLLGVDLRFDIRPAGHGRRGYHVLDVKAAP